VDLDLTYRIEVEAAEAVRAQAQIATGFKTIETAATQAGRTIDQSFRGGVVGLGSFEQGMARARAQLLAYARAGIQAKADIERLGGAQKLTTAEIDRYIGVITRAAKANETLGRSNKALESDQARLLAHLKSSRASAEDLAASKQKVSAAGVAMSGMLTRLTGAFAGYLSINAIAGAIRSTARYADELKAVSARTGLTVEAVQRLGYAARTNGTTLDRLSSSLSIMQDRIGEGNEQALNALNKLGLSVQQLERMKPDEQLFAISDGLKRIGSHNEQVATLNDLLGRGGAELLPAFAAGLREAAGDAERFGQVMSESAVESAERLDTFLENWGVKVKVTMGETIQDFDEAGSNIKRWADGVVQNMALALGAIASLAGVTPKAGVTSGFSPTPWGSGPAVGSPSNPFVQNPSLLFGMDPNTDAGMAAIRAIEDQLTNSAKEQIRLAKEREAVLKRQTDELKRQKQALDQMIRAESEALILRVHGAAWWGQSGMTGESVGGSAWDAFMKGGSLPLSYFTGRDRGNQAAIRDAGFESRFLLPPSTIAGIGQQIPLEDAFPPGEDFGLNWGQEFTVGLKQRFREFADEVKANPEGLIPLVLDDLFRGGPHDAMGNFAANMAQTATQIIGDLIIPGLGQVLSPIVGDLLYKPSMQANDMRDQFIDQNGGFGDLHRRSAEAGAENQFRLMLWADSPERLQRAIENLTEAIEEAERARRDDIESLLSDRGLVDANLVSTIAGRRDFLNGDAERKALEQFYTGNLSRAAGGYQAFLGAGGQVSAENAAGFGAGVAGIFGEMVGSGMASPLEALKALEPIIAGLQAQFAKLGVDGGAAFADIASLAQFAADEAVAPAIAQVLALNDVLVGLGNTALLDQDMFKAFEDQIGATYQTLLDQGKNGDQALRLMQPTLQTLWELEQDRGFAVDGTTREMLDQAEAAGIVGDGWRSAEERMIKALDNLIARIDILITELFPGIGDAAGDAAGEVTDKFADISENGFTIPIDFDINYDPSKMPQIPNGGDYPDASQAARGGYVTPYGVQHLALGGMAGFPGAPRGTDTEPAWLTPGEFVMRREAVDRLGVGTLQALNRGDGTGGVTVNLTINAVDGESVARVVKTREFGDALVDVFSRNTHQVRTRSRNALGVVQ
jgi:hypothetical protein